MTTDVGDPRAGAILTAAAANGGGRQTVALGEVVAALAELSRSPAHPAGWVSTGAVADAIGVTVGVAAAHLRAAHRRRLCTVRRSLREGTSWKASCRSGATQGSSNTSTRATT